MPISGSVELSRLAERSGAADRGEEGRCCAPSCVQGAKRDAARLRSLRDETAPVLLLALGNPLMSDDGVGQELLAKLESEAARWGSRVEFLDGGTQGLALLGKFEGRKAVVFTSIGDVVGNWKTAGATLGAMVASLVTLACCLPLPFLGAAGIAGASVFLAGARPWLLGLSVVLLVGGFFQVYRGVRCRTGQNKTAIAMLGLATMIVVLLLLFPQAIASILADIPGGRR